MSKQIIWQYPLFILIIATLLLDVGCVRRRMAIRAFPEGNAQMPITGAMVYVNKQPVGRTPVTCNFTHYGTMEFTLVKEGYEPLTEYRKVRAPWYQWPGIDFFSEVVWPQEITDTKLLDFQLKPARLVTQDELIDRAEGLRRESQSQARFRASSGTTSNITGIIDPFSSPVDGAGAMSGTGAVAPPSGSETVPTGAGSIGAPISPFVNPANPSGPWSEQNAPLTPMSNPYHM